MPKSQKPENVGDNVVAESVDGANTKKKKSISKSQKAGLLMPVARFNKYMKKNSGLKRVGASAPVFAAAVIEYVASELVDVAGNVTSDAGRKTISPDDLMKAVRKDRELSRLFAGNSVALCEKLGKVTDVVTYKDKSKKVSENKS